MRTRNSAFTIESDGHLFAKKLKWNAAVKRSALIAIILTLCSACSKVSVEPIQPQEQKVVGNNLVGFSKREKSNAYGTYTLYSIKADFLKTVELASRELGLDSLHTDSFGFQAFAVKNHPVPGSVVILPKILIKNKFGDERPSIERLADGTLKMFLEIAFINGQEQAAQLGISHYPLSSDYKIADKDGFLKFITAKICLSCQVPREHYDRKRGPRVN